MKYQAKKITMNIMVKASSGIGKVSKPTDEFPEHVDVVIEENCYYLDGFGSLKKKGKPKLGEIIEIPYSKMAFVKYKIII